MRRDLGQGYASEDKELVGVKNAVLVIHENDELIAVFLLQLTPPALQALTVEQLMGKGCVAVVGSGLLACAKVVR